MTAVAVEQQPVHVSRAKARPVPWSRLTAVELRKMFDTRSGFWLLASIAISAVLASGAVVLFAPDDQISYGVFATAFGFPMAVILPMIAILSVTSEWSQRSGLTTFTSAHAETVMNRLRRAIGAMTRANVKMSVRNRARAETTLEWSQVTKRYLSIYEGFMRPLPVPAIVARPTVSAW